MGTAVIIPSVQAVYNSGSVAPSAMSGCTNWYDFTDISTVFQDTGRTSAVTTDGQSIKGVTDKVGTSHLSQAGVAPLYKTGLSNGKSGARWDGTTTINLANAGFSLAQPATFIIAANTTDTAAQKNVIDGITVRIAIVVQADSKVGLYAGGTQRAFGAAEGAWHVIDVVAVDAASSVFIGVDGTEGAALNSTGSNALTGLHIGTDDATGGKFQGDIAHIAMFSRALTLTERKQVVRWMGNELGVTIA